MSEPSRRKSVNPLALPVVLGACVAVVLGLIAWEDPQTAGIVAGVVLAPFALYYFFAFPLWGLAITNSVHAYALDLGGGFWTPYKFAVALAVLATLRHIRRRRRFASLPRNFTRGLVFFAALVVLGEAFAEYEASLLVFAEFGSSIIIFLCTSQLLEKPEDIWVFPKVYTINIIIVAFTVLREGSWSMLNDGGGRLSGVVGQPNALGIFAANILPLCMALSSSRDVRTGWRVAGVLGLVGVTYSEWAAASRGGSVGAVTAMVVFAWFAGKTVPRRLLLLAGVVLAINVVVELAPASFSRVTATFSFSAESGTIDVSERADHVALGQEMFPRHPWLGHGFSAFGYERSRTTGALGQSLHSAFFAVLVAYGVFAGLLFLALPLGAAATVLWRVSDRNRLASVAFGASVLGTFAASTTGSNIFGPETWSSIAICYIFALRVREAAEARPAAAPAATRARPGPATWPGHTRPSDGHVLAPPSQSAG